MSQATGCPEYRRQLFSRREALRIGALGGMGLTLSNILRHEATAAPAMRPQAKSVILLWLQGGVSHHETFDMKPDAASEIRGEQSPISTNLPGYYVNEYLPRLATMMDKLAVIRSMTHREGAHERGSMYMVEGRRPGPAASGAQPSGNPHLGCIVGHQLGMPKGIPSYVSIPGNDFTSRFVGPGYLPRGTAGFKGYQSKSLEVPSSFSTERFDGRLSLRGQLENAGRTASSLRGQSWDQFNDQALDIIASAKAAAAFDIERESAETQRLYGVIDRSGKRLSGQMGQLSLTARRLVESGVRFVTVGRNSWDHHSTIFPQLRSRLPRVDMAFAGLVQDLEQRGLLDETLVVYLTEFGRTPKINSQAGRDHWSRAFSVAFAGAGIKTGQIIGSTDSIGGDVTEHPVSPEEIAATILHLVGIDPQTEYLRSDGRPISFIDEAKPIRTLLA